MKQSCFMCAVVDVQCIHGANEVGGNGVKKVLKGQKMMSCLL